MDNTTTISYINKMGGTHSPTLAKMACILWQWWLGREIVLSVEHLPGSHDCGQGLLDLPLFSRVATTQDSVPKYSNLTRSVPSRPFCYMSKLPTSPVCELVARPIRHGYGCIPSPLDKPGRLCLSFLFSGRQD